MAAASRYCGGEPPQEAVISAFRQLLLMRHAKSSWDDPRLSDHARPLNPRGRAAAAAMRGMMQAVGLAPDIVLVSSARRTLQTLEALEPWDDTPLVEPMDALYLADPAQLLQLLHGVAETARSVLVLGHNPGLHDLALLLAGSGDEAVRHRLGEGFPSGALAEFSVPGSWAALGEGGGRLVRFVTPRDLPGE
jgi:phosphohistidine phosphatase